MAVLPSKNRRASRSARQPLRSLRRRSSGQSCEEEPPERCAVESRPARHSSRSSRSSTPSLWWQRSPCCFRSSCASPPVPRERHAKLGGAAQSAAAPDTPSYGVSFSMCPASSRSGTIDQTSLRFTSQRPTPGRSRRHRRRGGSLGVHGRAPAPTVCTRNDASPLVRQYHPHVGPMLTHWCTRSDTEL